MSALIADFEAFFLTRGTLRNLLPNIILWNNGYQEEMNLSRNLKWGTSSSKYIGTLLN